MREPASSVVVIGNFDGVHRGHQAVLGDAALRARHAERDLVVLTFDPHPSSVVGRGEPARLTTTTRRVELLERHGATRVAVKKFDREFAAQSPLEFATHLLRDELHAAEVVVGQNFRFGAKRAGDLSTLGEIGNRLGFTARAHAVAEDDRGAFSSTRARSAIGAGDLDEAMAVLGRWHAISGVVKKGNQLGRTLGFPTANLHDIPEIQPPDGIYSVLVDIIGRDGHAKALAPGVMAIGMRPTIEGATGRTSEVFLFDFSRDIYGAHLRVHFVAHQRAEKKFDGLDALVAQMRQDEAEARAKVAKISPNPDLGGAYG
ncbi:MAG: bifunctional riboflavin kinase/FAD synthetase [Polyangiaceae bacterium]